MKDTPAFPYVLKMSHDDGLGHATGVTSVTLDSGMTLHQWFAGMALQGLLACPNTNTTFEGFASDSLKYADAMIAAYEQKP